MKQTRINHLLDLLNSGCGFQAAVLLTSLYFKVPQHQIVMEFYR